MYSLSTDTIPYYDYGVPAGFPSIAEDYIEQALNLNELVVKHPAATFFVRVEGESMQGAGIFTGDILVVDRSLFPSSGQIVIALLNGEFTVKRLKKEKQRILLVAEHPSYAPIIVSEESDFQVWGVVTYVIHRTC